jgi:hypothetical protein
MKKWDNLNILEKMKVMDSLEKSFHPTEGTLLRLYYAKEIYDLTYEKFLEGPENGQLRTTSENTYR